MRRLALALLFACLTPSVAGAAISCALLNNNTSATDATSYTTDSVTLTSGRVYFLWLASRVSSGTVNTPSVSSSGDTWARANGGTNDQVSSFQQQISVWVGTGSGAGQITVDYSSQTQLQFLYAVIECSGVDTTDPVQTSYAENTGTATSDTLTFSAFANSANRPMVGFVLNEPSTVPDSDWTQLSDQSVNEASDTGMEISWNNSSSDLTVTHNNGSNAVYKNVGLEIKAASTGKRGVVGGGCCGGLID